MIDETPIHLFYNCTKAKLLRDQLKEFPSPTPQSAVLGHIDLSDDYLLINHLSHIYKTYLYISPETGAILTLSI